MNWLYLPPNTIDIKTLIKPLVATPIDNSVIDRFEKEYNLYQLRNSRGKVQPPRLRPTFLEWRKSGGSPWKLYWWYDLAEPPKDALNTLIQDTGKDSYHFFIGSAHRSDYKRGDWVLCFKKSEDQDSRIRTSRFKWFIPEQYSKTRAKNWTDASHIWFQIGRLPATPFNEKDPVFKQAFKQAIVQLDNDTWKAVNHDFQPTEDFLAILEKRYKQIVASHI